MPTCTERSPAEIERFLRRLDDWKVSELGSAVAEIISDSREETQQLIHDLNVFMSDKGVSAAVGIGALFNLLIGAMAVSTKMRDRIQ